MNGGEIIVKALQANRVLHLFTLCGGHISPIYVAAERAGMKVWDVRHESNAVFAADAVARMTGIPGVVAVTAGPGVTNAITGIKNAQLVQSPVLLLGGATATLLRNHGALQDIDQMSIIHSSVKYSVQLKRFNEIEVSVQNAIHSALSNVPGPVFIECPVDLLYPETTIREWYGRKDRKPSGWKEQLQEWYINRHVERMLATGNNKQHAAIKKPSVPSHSSSEVEKAGRIIRQSQKPILLLGSNAVLIPSLANELARAVKRTGIPVYLSGMARGLLGKNNTLQMFHHRKKALREADLIIQAGVPCDFRLDYGRNLNRNAKKITINRSKYELIKNIRPTLAVNTDPASFLIELSNFISPQPRWESWKKILQDRDTEREKEIDQMAAEKKESINPLALFRQMDSLLPDNSVLVADGGDFAASASYALKPRKPLSWLDPGVFGTLGVGGGFALGAAACNPDDYIWIIYGDGSVAYSIAEFETFAKNKLKVCGIVGNNGSWEQIARDQIKLLGADTAVRLPKTDYHKIAEGYGASGEKAETINEFSQAMHHAIESMNKGVPYLINAMIGSTAFREGSISI